MEFIILIGLAVVGLWAAGSGSTTDKLTSVKTYDEIKPTKSSMPYDKATPLCDISTTGHVKWWNSEMEFGFITTDDGADIFFHISELRSSTKVPVEGQHVQFKVKQAPNKNFVAIQIEYINALAIN